MISHKISSRLLHVSMYNCINNILTKFVSVNFKISGAKIEIVLNHSKDKVSSVNSLLCNKNSFFLHLTYTPDYKYELLQTKTGFSPLDSCFLVVQ